ncbi:MAG TPA: zinc-binding alcohol dehydrogenase, partial [Armatimonadota bacterium]|nr:zinc-binding alcohol dehydrogenase [Armatimonadota bacterium]
MNNPQITFPGPEQIEIVDAGMPELAPRQVRIRTRASLISAGTEGSSYLGRQWLHGDGTVMPTYPAAPGYSNAGVVCEVGEEVERFAVGDRVTSSGGHSQYIVLPEGHDALWRVPDEVDDEAATFTVLGCTVLNGVRMGRPGLGDVVAVVGLGILGQLACRYLRLFGARPIIGIDLDPTRLEIAERAGAIDVAINPGEADVVAAVRELTVGRGADIVFEVTGRTETFDLTFDLARRHGTVVALGSPRWPAQVDMMKLHLKAITCVGAIVSAHPRPG